MYIINNEISEKKYQKLEKINNVLIDNITNLNIDEKLCEIESIINIK